MQYVDFGRTGLRVSRLGFGGIPVQRIDEPGTRAMLKAAHEAGINYIDTARAYTVSEEWIGQALEELGLRESGLDRLIQCSYELLGLISFLTYGKDECRAWTIRKGTKAPQAAGKIHSDIERGFIRAETINFDEMMACGSVAAAKEKGLLRSEGKDYVVKDGDMIYFRFNV